MGTNKKQSKQRQDNEKNKTKKKQQKTRRGPLRSLETTPGTTQANTGDLNLCWQQNSTQHR